MCMSPHTCDRHVPELAALLCRQGRDGSWPILPLSFRVQWKVPADRLHFTV